MISIFSKGIYGFLYLPAGSKSYENKHIIVDESSSSIWPLILFVILRFCTSGIVLIPFMMLSELFPFKSRGIATGFTAAVGFIIAFTATKSFYNIESFFSLPAALILYGVIGCFGLVAAYKILPETEKCTLEDIEMHFSDNSKSLTDRKIARNQFSTPNMKDVETGSRKGSTAKGCTNKGYADDRY